MNEKRVNKAIEDYLWSFGIIKQQAVRGEITSGEAMRKVGKAGLTILQSLRGEE